MPLYLSCLLDKGLLLKKGGRKENRKKTEKEKKKETLTEQNQAEYYANISRLTVLQLEVQLVSDLPFMATCYSSPFCTMEKSKRKEELKTLHLTISLVKHYRSNTKTNFPCTFLLLKQIPCLSSGV